MRYGTQFNRVVEYHKERLYDAMPYSLSLFGGIKEELGA